MGRVCRAKARNKFRGRVAAPSGLSIQEDPSYAVQLSCSPRYPRQTLHVRTLTHPSCILTGFCRAGFNVRL